jgi:TolB-like protein/DNA-binding winged helix-turn-helix (wHTH) protein/Tfp pilus assembly protein PilF
MFAFGPFRLDTLGHTLRKDAKTIPLPPKAFELLVLLVRRNGELLTKGELLNTLWPNTFVEENNLTQYVSMLRKLLGESANDEEKFIETVPRLGYRFVAQVRMLSADGVGEVGLAKHTTTRIVVREEEELEETDEPSEEASPDSLVTLSLENAQSQLPASRRLRRWRSSLATLSFAVIAVVAVFVYKALWPLRAPAAFASKRTLAVLPLANLSGDPQQEAFADAITDSLTTELGQLHDLRVISETSAMYYKGTHKKLPEIARELAVSGVVEGSVYRSGNHVRITAQLVDASSDQQLWANSYEAELGDVLRLQDRVARDIAAQIRVTLTPQEQMLLSNARTVKPEAYNLFLEGQYFEGKITEDFLQKAIHSLQRSIEIDGTYAPAHTALAMAYERLTTNGYAPPTSVFPKAEAELKTALEMDPSSSQVHANLSYIKLAYDWDWQGAEKEIHRAFELSPNSEEARSGIAQMYLIEGRFDDSLAEMRQAQTFDPVGLESRLYLGQYCLVVGQYEQSIAAFQRTLELDPNFLPTHAEMALAYTRMGKKELAVVEYEKTRALMGPRQALILDQWMAPVEILLGKRELAVQTARWWTRESAHRYTDPYILAAYYAELGWSEQSFDFLFKAIERRSPSMIYLRVDKSFPAAMRNDSRFHTLLQKLNYPENATVEH